MRHAAAVIALTLMVAPSVPLAQPSLDDAFRTFWSAEDPSQAAAAGEAIARIAGFDQAFERLRRGRPVRADAPEGVVRASHETGGRTFAYSVEVPQTYDPARRYQVRFQLHGGVGRPEAAPRGTGRSARWPGPNRST